MKRIIALMLAISLLIIPARAAADDMEEDSGEVDASIFEENAEETLADGDIDIIAPTAILVEKETGQVIYEKNADELYEPASVTKVMTILLIVEAIESGKISLDTMVPVSAYASSMGGSQVYLEEGETMSVHEMLKSIVVSSANDAAVAVAELLCGTEQAFAAEMNKRAAELGMKNTVFHNCTGLLDDPEHLTTARDISLMSRELIKHDMVKDYTTIWMDTIRNGEFGLSNTNKLIYYYDGSTGLKTGFTSKAGYCLSATAKRDGIEYIAVVMHCETSSDRFESAKTLLNYAFANYTTVNAVPGEVMLPIPVKLGACDYVQPEMSRTEKLLVQKSNVAQITCETSVEEQLMAPVEDGQRVGTFIMRDGDKTLIEIPIVAECGVERLTTGNIFFNMIKMMFGG